MVALTVPFAAPLESAALARVALWIDDRAQAAACRARLSAFAVEEVADAAALERLAATSLELLVTSWREGLVELALRLGLRLIVVGDSLPEPLVDGLGRGLHARHVTQVEAVADEVRRFTRAARAADATRYQLSNCEVRLRGAASAWPLIDLSNDGLSFLVEDADLEPLLPESELGAVEVLRAGAVCLDGVTARVRHVEPLGPGRYRIGCALEATPPATPPRVTRLRDRALCAALVKAATRGGIVLAPLERDERAQLDLELTGARVDVAAGTLVASGDSELPELAMVRGRFEVAGRLYRFTSVVVARAPLTLKLPTTIEESQQRAAVRYRPAAEEGLAVELCSTLSGAVTRKPLLDLSSTGISVAVDGTGELFPIGLRLGLVLHLPDGPLRASGSVRTLSREGGRLRCGIELLRLDEAAHARVCELLLRRRAAAIGDGVGLPFDHLADFFRATGFLPPDKEAVLAPMLPAVRQTFEALYRRPSKLFKAVVSRDGNQVTGHVSVVRAYRHTGMTHHLAADSGRHVAHLLNISAAEYFGLSPDLEYGKIWFHADNKWPARVFGGFARTMRDSSQSELRANVHLTLPTGAHFGRSLPDVEVVEAGERELAAIEHYFVARERGLLLRADDLLRRTLTLDSVDRDYRELGLFRRRRVLVAMRRGLALGFAFAELSSPGLNLYETLSMFRTFVLPDGEQLSPSVRVTLLNALSQLYAAEGRSYMRGIFDPAESDDYARLGFTSAERSFTWTWHRALCPRFCDHVERLFEVLARRRNRGVAAGAVGASR